MPARIAPGSVKICGNRDPEFCRLAARAGADMLGFIFVPGTKRNVELEIAAECIAASKRSVSQAPLAVGVFVDERPEHINDTARRTNLDVIQLHGQESATDLERIERSVIKVIRPTASKTLDEIKRALDTYLTSSNTPVAFLVDGYDAKLHGGAGVKADWDLAADLAANFPVLLAGGLDAENVADAIGKVRPIGVDVSSGVETDGVRDPEKLQSFIGAAKLGFSNFAPRNLTVIA
jgi:phosphoribosylanthranilate isomerase